MIYKAMFVQVIHLNKNNTKLMALNESFLVSSHYITALTMTLLRQKRCAKGKEKLRKTIAGQQFGLYFHTKYNFSAGCLKGAAELQHFSSYL